MCPLVSRWAPGRLPLLCRYEHACTSVFVDVRLHPSWAHPRVELLGHMVTLSNHLGSCQTALRSGLTL